MLDIQPRVVLRFPPNADDMLLSGGLVGGQTLANRAQVVDAPVGKGHVVMFAIRPFWRWQTQGTFFLGFNTILHWNDLDAGRPSARASRNRAVKGGDTQWGQSRVTVPIDCPSVANHTNPLWISEGHLSL